MIPSNPFDAGWLVGFLEGEGSFASQRSKAGSPQKWPRVEAVNCDEASIDRLVAVAGGRKNGPYAPRASVGYASKAPKPQWRWRLSTKVDVIELLVWMQPHMTPRRAAQIQAVLEAAA